MLFLRQLKAFFETAFLGQGGPGTVRCVQCLTTSASIKGGLAFFTLRDRKTKKRTITVCRNCRQLFPEWEDIPS
jgi:hypothetical protein